LNVLREGYRHCVNFGRESPVPKIRARKSFPQACHSRVTSRMGGENRNTVPKSPLAGVES